MSQSELLMIGISMVLAASEGENVGVLLTDAEPGTRVLLEGQEDAPAAQIDLQAFFNVKIKTDGEGAIYRNEALAAGGRPIGVDKGLSGPVS